MLGRLFGRGKGERDEAVCAACGRTLLAGEWTQKVQDEDGVERLLCSLCGQAPPGAGGERLKVGNGTASAVRLGADRAGPAAPPAEDGEPGRPAGRGENDALWKAIKDRDAQIERLEQQLARSEAERQELLAQLAQARAVAGTVGPGRAAGAADTGQTPAPTAEATEAAPAEAAVPAAQADERAPAEAEETVVAQVGAPPTETNTTPAPAAAGTATAAETAPGEGPPAAPHKTQEQETEGVAAAGADEAGEVTAEIAVPAADAGTAAAALTVLQRGVDLLNVSPVPRKIAETNADLGIPSVHVGYEDDLVAVTFMWTMGWYRFTVAVDSGAIKLADRGYDERADLQPNASVRADGTVQLAPARISPAAAQRQQTGSASAAPAAEPAAERDAGPTVTPPSGGPEILSKSLLGQRTDDEQQSWEKTRARDFDWDR